MPGKRDRLQEVREAADEAASVRLRLHEAIREATRHGYSLRVVADAASVSHEQVRRLLGCRAVSTSKATTASTTTTPSDA